MATRRVSDEPAFVLHRYDWSESSLILEVFTRHLGRLALVAKGVKKPSSSFRPVLLPLQPLRLALGGEGEIKTLKAAEWQGGHVMPTGEALWSGCYLNELLLNLLAREDPHPALFDAYAHTVAVLAGGHGGALEATLRAFELLLLRELGLLPQLDVQTATLEPVRPLQPYVWQPQEGLRLAQPEERPALDGQHWLDLQRALAAADAWMPLLQACAQAGGALKVMLRQGLHYHCGVPVLRTRQLMQDLQSL